MIRKCVQEESKNLDIRDRGDISNRKKCHLGSLDETLARTLFIEDLDPSVDVTDVKQMLSHFGTVTNCHLAKDESGQSKGCALAQFENEGSAKVAASRLDGMVILAKVVRVTNLNIWQKRDYKSTTQYTTVYVKNFGTTFTEKDLIKMFEAFGEVKSSILLRHLGLGFVTFADMEIARSAVASLNGLLVSGAAIYVAIHPKDKNEQQQKHHNDWEKLKQDQLDRGQRQNTVYLSNLDDSVEPEFIREQFEQYGTVLNMKVLDKKKDEVANRFGFVRFSKVSEAVAAVYYLNGCDFRGKPLYVTLALPKEVRKGQLKWQQIQKMSL